MQTVLGALSRGSGSTPTATVGGLASTIDAPGADADLDIALRPQPVMEASEQVVISWTPPKTLVEFGRQSDSLRQAEDGVLAWLGNRGLLISSERLRELSSKGDDLDRLKRLVDFELFAPTSRRLSLSRIDARVGGRRSIMC